MPRISILVVFNEMSWPQMSTYCVIPFVSTKIGNGSLCCSKSNQCLPLGGSNDIKGVQGKLLEFWYPCFSIWLHEFF